MQTNQKKLNPDQRAYILNELKSGYSDLEIKDRIDLARQNGDTCGDEYWPEITRQGLHYYRERFKNELDDAQANIFDIALSTGIGKRQVALRRASRRLGSLDALMDQLDTEINRLIAEGVLRGTPFYLADNPDVIESGWVQPDGSIKASGPPALTVPIQGDPASDPRFDRLLAMIDRVAKLGVTHEKYLTYISKVTGMFRPVTESEDASSPSEKRRLAEDMFERIRTLQREKQPVMRKGA